jgi:hypothetical protein
VIPNTENLHPYILLAEPLCLGLYAHSTNKTKQKGPDFQIKYTGEKMRLIEVIIGRYSNGISAKNTVLEFCRKMHCSGSDFL